jgi:predicted transcriptional regulator
MADVKNRSGVCWCILYSKELSQSEKMVFIALKDRAYQVDKACVKGFYCYLDWLEANLNMSDKTVQKAIKALREKNIISSKRVKVHKKVVNQWTINWNVIDMMQKQFKFAEVEYEEVDVLDETPVQSEVAEVKTPIIQIKTSGYEKDLENYSTILSELLLGDMESEQYSKTQTMYSKKLSKDYNKEWDEVESELGAMVGKKALRTLKKDIA